MKDEEMAEEYAIKSYGNDAFTQAHMPQMIEPVRMYLKQGFLEGLRTGRPQLHDLRKDPNDLPKDNDEKLCFYEKRKVVARYDSEYDCWETEFNNIATTFSSSILIGWCEIPTFDEE